MIRKLIIIRPRPNKAQFSFLVLFLKNIQNEKLKHIFSFSIILSFIHLLNLFLLDAFFVQKFAFEFRYPRLETCAQDSGSHSNFHTGEAVAKGLSLFLRQANSESSKKHVLIDIPGKVSHLQDHQSYPP